MLKSLKFCLRLYNRHHNATSSRAKRRSKPKHNAVMATKEAIPQCTHRRKFVQTCHLLNCKRLPHRLAYCLHITKQIALRHDNQQCKRFAMTCFVFGVACFFITFVFSKYQDCGLCEIWIKHL